MKKEKTNVLGILDYLLFLLLATVAGGVSLQVLMRYAFKVPLSWVDEVVTQSFIFLVFAGALKALRLDQNIYIDAILRFLKHPVREVVELIIYGLMFLLVLVIVIYGAQFAYLNLGQKSISLQVPVSYYNLILPVCAFFMGLTLVKKIVRTLKMLMLEKSITTSSGQDE